MDIIRYICLSRRVYCFTLVFTLKQSCFVYAILKSVWIKYILVQNYVPNLSSNILLISYIFHMVFWTFGGKLCVLLPFSETLVFIIFLNDSIQLVMLPYRPHNRHTLKKLNNLVEQSTRRPDYVTKLFTHGWTRVYWYIQLCAQPMGLLDNPYQRNKHIYHWGYNTL